MRPLHTHNSFENFFFWCDILRRVLINNRVIYQTINHTLYSISIESVILFTFVLWASISWKQFFSYFYLFFDAEKWKNTELLNAHNRWSIEFDRTYNFTEFHLKFLLNSMVVDIFPSMKTGIAVFISKF